MSIAIIFTEVVQVKDYSKPLSSIDGQQCIAIHSFHLNGNSLYLPDTVYLKEGQTLSLKIRWEGEHLQYKIVRDEWSDYQI